MSQKKPRNFFPFNIIREVKDKKRAKKRSEEIDQQILSDRKSRRRKWKTNVVVTGLENSGKSTLIEQLKLQKSFSIELDAAVKAKSCLRSDCIRILTDIYISKSSCSLELADMVISDEENSQENENVVSTFLREVEDQDIDLILKEKADEMSEYQKYLFKNFYRILDPEYSITFEDFVIWRKSSISKLVFVQEVVKFQATEKSICNINITHFRRRISGKIKVISYFKEEINIILYCYPLNKICCLENSDSMIDQLKDDLAYFTNVTTTSHIFPSLFAPILFLTKFDEFQVMFDNFVLPDEFLDFVSKRQLKSHGATEFCEYVTNVFEDAIQTDARYGRTYIHSFVVNSLNWEHMEKTVNVAMEFLASLNLIGRNHCCDAHPALW